MTVMGVIRGIVSVAYILIVSPLFLGNMLCRRLEGKLLNNHVLWYVAGFFSQLGIWGILAFPITILYAETFPFSDLCYIFLFIMLLMDAIWLIKRLRVHTTLATIRENIRNNRIRLRKDIDESLLFRWNMYLFVFIVLAEIIFAIYGVSSEYQDNTHYIPEALVIVVSDRLQVLPTYGAKRVMAPWFSYMASLSFFSGLTPAFIYETVTPIFVLMLFYGGMYVLAMYIFQYDNKRSLYFITAVAIAVAILNTSISPTYYHNTIQPQNQGKTILGGIVLPVMLMLYCVASEQKRKWRMILLLSLFSLGGAWLSATSILIIPCAVCLVGLILLVRYRSRVVVYYGIAEIIGPILQLLVYFVVYRGASVG